MMDNPVNNPEPPNKREAGTEHGKPAGQMDKVGAKRVGEEDCSKERSLSRGAIAWPKSLKWSSQASKKSR